MFRSLRVRLRASSEERLQLGDSDQLLNNKENPMGYVASHMAAVPSSGFRGHVIFLESPPADEIKRVDATQTDSHPVR